MGSSFIISKSLLDKNGKKLMLDFYEKIHDEYMLTYDEFKCQRKFYDDNVVDTYKKWCLDKMKLFKNLDNGGNIFSRYSEDFSKLIDHVKMNGKWHTEIEGCKVEEVEGTELLTYIENKIKNCTIDLRFVYEFLSNMDKELKLNTIIEMELDEDLYCLKSAFLQAYELFHFNHYNLEV